MKLFSFLIVCALSLSSFSQDQACGQVPMGNVDVKASAKTKIAGQIEKNIDDQLKSRDYQAVFKLLVDCKGTVVKCSMQSGDMLSAEVKGIEEIILKSKWNPAYIGQESVNSMVFLTLNLKKGKAELLIQ